MKKKVALIASLCTKAKMREQQLPETCEKGKMRLHTSTRTAKKNQEKTER